VTRIGSDWAVADGEQRAHTKDNPRCAGGSDAVLQAHARCAASGRPELKLLDVATTMAASKGYLRVIWFAFCSGFATEDPSALPCELRVRDSSCACIARGQVGAVIIAYARALLSRAMQNTALATGKPPWDTDARDSAATELAL